MPGAGHSFRFETKDGSHAPMCRSWLLACCNEALSSMNLNTLSGHSFRIGGTTHLLLLGVDPFIVMAQGHWKSSAFLDYWCLCEEIIPTFIGFSLSSKSLLLSYIKIN